jgi:hypothetical protein
VASNLVEKMDRQVKHPPDFADYREAFRPWIAREILLARIAEAKTFNHFERVRALEKQLAQIEIDCGE